jgi:hypothetical protein
MRWERNIEKQNCVLLRETEVVETVTVAVVKVEAVVKVATVVVKVEAVVKAVVKVAEERKKEKLENLGARNSWTHSNMLSAIDCLRHSHI